MVVSSVSYLYRIGNTSVTRDTTRQMEQLKGTLAAYNTIESHVNCPEWYRLCKSRIYARTYSAVIRLSLGNWTNTFVLLKKAFNERSISRYDFCTRLLPLIGLNFIPRRLFQYLRKNIYWKLKYANFKNSK